MNRRSLIKTLGGLSIAPFLPSAVASTSVATKTDIKLFPFQKEIVEKTKNLGVNLFLMPRASGKTFIFKYLGGKVNSREPSCIHCVFGYPHDDVGNGEPLSVLNHYGTFRHDHFYLFCDEFYKNKEGTISSYLKCFAEERYYDKYSFNFFFSLTKDNEKEIKEIKDSGLYNFHHYPLKDIEEFPTDLFSGVDFLVCEDPYDFKREFLCEFTV